MSPSVPSAFRRFSPPIAPALPLQVAPRLWSWEHAGHPSQHRLSASLDHLVEQLERSGLPAGPLSLQLNVALDPGADLFGSGDLDNYLIPIAIRMGGDRFASMWATKAVGGQSTVQVEVAREGRAEDVAGWRFAGARATGSATQEGWKRHVRDQVAAQATLAPDGPLEMQVGFRTGAERIWTNLWKQSIDALGPVLGLTLPDRPFHPLDGRIVRLGLHHTRVPDLGFDVELGVWWRSVEREGWRPTSRARSASPSHAAAGTANPLPAPERSARGDPRAEGRMAQSDDVIVFRNDDDGYVRWIQAHPAGYVVNTTPKFSPKYLKLHLATCPFVCELQRGSARWTSGQYVKVCSTERAALARWAREQAQGALQDSCNCRP
jgi:hypothetical protein